MNRTFVAEFDAPRLDAFLAARLPGHSRVFVKEAIKRGEVTVDGAAAKGGDQRVRAGQSITLKPRLVETTDSAGFESWVLFEDKRLLVLNKPSGLLMHPLGTSWLTSPEAARVADETNLAAELSIHRPVILRAGTPRCGIVHRLDRQTSGVLVVAKDPETHAALSGAFKERLTEKTYRAIVRGTPHDQARISAPIGRNPGHRKIVVTRLGKPAETSFRVLKRGTSSALIEAKPLTGRTHQIRAHLAFMGFPVAGDLEFDRKNDPAAPRLMLHAYRLAFEHPSSGRPAVFTAEPPADFRRYWKKISAA